MSGFTSILKSVGIVAAEAGLSYVGLADVSQKLFKNGAVAPPGVVPSKLQDLYDVIKQVQFVSGILGDNVLTNEQKRSMVVPAMTLAFLDIEDFRGKKPEDEAIFRDNINKMVDAMVGAANQFKK